MDSVDFKIVAGPFKEFLKQTQLEQRRATMWAVREGGRKVKSAARKAAPVRTGRLKRSISSSKRLKGDPDTGVSVTVGPRGYPPVAYAGKEEAKHHFMAAGYAAVAPQMRQIAERAWAKALERTYK